MKSLSSILTPPILSAALLAGIVVENHSHVKPAVVEPFHVAAKAKIDAIPLRINSDGFWIGQPIPQSDDETKEAVKILHPNAYFSAHFVDTLRFPMPGVPMREADMLVVQCKDANDMQGHYPPICYPAHGDTQVSAHDRTFIIGDLSIPFTEYEFVHTSIAEVQHKYVYDFLIVPRKGIYRGMNELRHAASDYQQRYYGAAQFQVLFTAELPPAERDEIFKTLIGANTAVVQTLVKGAIQ
jgi:hypothetical protein